MEQDIQEKIGQIQLIQQNLQNLATQRQQFQLQQSELETALKELRQAKTSYRIIGNIMVAQDSAALIRELSEKQETVGVRVTTIEKQEAKLKEKVEEIQKEVLATLEESKPAKKHKESTHDVKKTS